LDIRDVHLDDRHVLGFFQVADRNDSASIVSQGDTLAAEQASCNNEFPGMLPSSPRVGDILKYGGWKMNPTQTFFSNGERALACGSHRERYAETSNS
jgi:hypothetical protein